jgi:hypothetical protein
MSEVARLARHEKRFPRATFARKLQRICEALDANAEAEVTSNLGRLKLTSRARVVRVWVAGSFARGALDCGDLDLVLELQRIEGGLPRATELARKLVGPLPYVSYYGGVPGDNSSGVAFPEAIEIWSGAGCDWRGRLATIAENPQAGPATRPTDILPVRPQQLGCGLEQLEHLVAYLEQGVLVSDFVPFSALEESAFAEEEPVGDGFFAGYVRELGQKSRRLLPMVSALLKTHEPRGSWTERGWGRYRELWYGGSLVELGPSKLPIHKLLEGVECAQIVIAPHISARGPNGAWLLRRGPNHPDAVLIRELEAWHLSYEGFPSLYTDMDTATEVLELFTSRAKAREFAPDDVEISFAKGEEVLRLCATADALDLNGDAWLAVREQGSQYAGGQLATVPALAKGLKNRPASRKR